MQAMTRARQAAVVGEGLALGCLALVAAAWTQVDTSWVPVITLDGWTMEEVADRLVKEVGLSAPAWVGLADAVLTRLPASDVTRS